MKVIPGVSWCISEKRYYEGYSGIVRVVLVGLLGRSGEGACPHLPQRRPAAVSAADETAEYQRFSSGIPARSGPLWQMWTTGAVAGPVGRVVARLGEVHDVNTGLGARAEGGRGPRERHLEVASVGQGLRAGRWSQRWMVQVWWMRFLMMMVLARVSVPGGGGARPRCRWVPVSAGGAPERGGRALPARARLDSRA